MFLFWFLPIIQEIQRRQANVGRVIQDASTPRPAIQGAPPSAAPLPPLGITPLEEDPQKEEQLRILRMLGVI